MTEADHPRGEARLRRASLLHADLLRGHEPKSAAKADALQTLRAAPRHVRGREALGVRGFIPAFRGRFMESSHGPASMHRRWRAGCGGRRSARPPSPPCLDSSCASAGIVALPTRETSLFLVMVLGGGWCEMRPTRRCSTRQRGLPYRSIGRPCGSPRASAAAPCQEEA